MSRDWDKELAKIDKQLESLPDDKLLPASRPAAGGRAAPGGVTTAAKPALPAGTAPAAPSSTRATVGVVLRLLLAVAVAIGIMFWPYDARCGAGLAGYLAAVAGVILAGGWSAIWTWRHRAARSHVLSIAVVAWGIALAAAEVLPRVGYAQPDPTRALWVCE